MFNNPFDSFHDTVAEAKEERERLDRLLTISTPRERLLVAGIGVLLLGLAAWLLLGSVSRSVPVAGVLVEPAGAAAEGNRSLAALAWIDRDLAPRLAPGMRAMVELGGVDGDAEALGGEIATIASVPLAGPLRGLELTAPAAARRIDITLDEVPGFSPPAGTRCRIVIELDPRSPIALFRARRP